MDPHSYWPPHRSARFTRRCELNRAERQQTLSATPTVIWYQTIPRGPTANQLTATRRPLHATNQSTMRAPSWSRGAEARCGGVWSTQHSGAAECWLQFKTNPTLHDLPSLRATIWWVRSSVAVYTYCSCSNGVDAGWVASTCTLPLVTRLFGGRCSSILGKYLRKQYKNCIAIDAK